MKPKTIYLASPYGFAAQWKNQLLPVFVETLESLGLEVWEPFARNNRENRRQRVKKVVEDPAYFTPPIVDDEDYIAEAYHMAVMPYQGFYIGRVPCAI